MYQSSMFTTCSLKCTIDKTNDICIEIKTDIFKLISVMFCLNTTLKDNVLF